MFREVRLRKICLRPCGVPLDVVLHVKHLPLTESSNEADAVVNEKGAPKTDTVFAQTASDHSTVPAWVLMDPRLP